MNKTIIKMEQIEKKFQSLGEDLTILKGIDLTIPEARVVAISGESGSGKSTLLNLIGGLDKPTSGNIFVDGERIDHLEEDELTHFRKYTVGLIFQFHYLLKDFTALENLLLAGYIGGKGKKETEDRGRYLLEQVKMSSRESHYPIQLSGGERQRVAVARALMNDPSIILADEPTGNLDAENTRNVEDILFNLVKSMGKTLLLVTHDLELAGRGDTHYRLQNGRLSEL